MNRRIFSYIMTLALMVLLYVDYDFNIKQGLYDKNNKICVMIYKYYQTIIWYTLLSKYHSNYLNIF